MNPLLLLRDPKIAIGASMLAVIIGLLFWVAASKLDHARTKSLLAQEKALVATIREQYATAAAIKAKAVSEALALQQEEMRRMALEADRLKAAATTATQRARTERREADRRLAVLESENELLREWSTTRIPDDVIDWMREPAAATAASP